MSRVSNVATPPRPLTSEERTLLDWLLRHGEDGADRYLPQLDYITVNSLCDCGCPSIGFALGPGAPAVSAPTGMVTDVRAVSPEGGETIGLILHALDGYLDELEVYRLSETAAKFSLPHIDTIEILPLIKDI